MNYLTCTKKARENIKTSVKQKLLQHSRFGCSICGKIPVVFHHIEQWSSKFSNDEKYLIPICDECHGRIHGRRGCLFSKKELYKYKAKPVRPLVLIDKFPLEKKRHYSFFIGSNFVAHGEQTSLFKIAGKYSLLSVDLSSGILKLSILAGIKDNKPIYLVKNNELIIDTRDIWKMDYSGNSLKIWRKLNGEKIVFIDLIIKPDIILIREMNTKFNGNVFQIYKLRAAQKRQIDKIARWVKCFEEYYFKAQAEIDKWPKVVEPFRGIDIDRQIKDLQKDSVKHKIEQKLRDKVLKEFKWDHYYAEFVLASILEKSTLFRKERKALYDSSEKLPKIFKMVEGLKKKYKQEFEDLNGTIVNYCGMILRGNIAL